ASRRPPARSRRSRRTSLAETWTPATSRPERRSFSPSSTPAPASRVGTALPGCRLWMGVGERAHGAGEVCGTTIETPMRAVVRLTVRKDVHVTAPEFLTADVPPVASRRRYATDGVGPDLMVAARDAVRRMIDWLGREHGLSAIDAY